MSEREICQTCRWWDRDGTRAAPLIRLDENDQQMFAHKCRKPAPPWQNTWPDSWCGEWESAAQRARDEKPRRG